MTKADIISEVSNMTGLTKVEIEAVLDSVIVSISDSLKQGNRVDLRGFGSFIIKQRAAREAQSHGLKEVEVWVKGPGSGRESAIRGLQAAGLDVTTIKDVTPVPHNGCRPPKRRRV